MNGKVNNVTKVANANIVNLREYFNCFLDNSNYLIVRAVIITNEAANLFV